MKQIADFSNRSLEILKLLSKSIEAIKKFYLAKFLNSELHFLFIIIIKIKKLLREVFSYFINLLIILTIIYLAIKLIKPIMHFYYYYYLFKLMFIFEFIMELHFNCLHLYYYCCY